MPVVSCEVCSKEYYVRPARHAAGKGKYCSRKCAADAKRKKNTVPCPWCGTHFLRRPNQIYCSRSCAASANHAYAGRGLDSKQETCKVCDKPLNYSVATGICSHTCLAEYRASLADPKSSKTPRCNYGLEFDPWETGEIPPDKFAENIYRQPDPVLGF